MNPTIEQLANTGNFKLAKLLVMDSHTKISPASLGKCAK
jgi:hypothetical protein